MIDKKVKLEIKILKTDTKTPTLGSKYAAGYDIYMPYNFEIKAYETKIVDTGIALGIPTDYYVQLHIRSSIGKRGLVIKNSIGIIDPDYKDELKSILYNSTNETIVIKKDERFAQLILTRRIDTEVIIVEELEGPDRGGGIGSTGR